MESWFSNRGYADSMINVKMKKVRFDGNKKMNESSNKEHHLLLFTTLCSILLEWFPSNLYFFILMQNL